MNNSSQYSKLGVDATKKSVRGTFEPLIDNDCPTAFVNIVADPLNKDMVLTQHMDGDGSKFVQRLLHFSETKDANILSYAADDALQMNLGDIAASGFVFGPILITDVININQDVVNKNIIMTKLGNRLKELIELHREHNFDIYFLGGETADLPNQVKNIAFDIAVSARAHKNEVVAGNIQPGDKIFGFASDGQAVWETEHNSGIMSNGLTLARVGTMWKGYQKRYPQLGMQNGRFKINQTAGLKNHRSISEALLSPTRHWSLVIHKILEKLKQADKYNELHGISFNTGGGITKIAQLGKGITYQKNMPKVPELFHLIQTETNENWRSMFEVFNCGVGIDVVGSSDKQFRKILEEVAAETNIQLFELGTTKHSNDGKNHVFAKTGFGNFKYD